MIEKSPILNFVTHAILLAAAFAMCFPIYVSLITATMPFERVAEVPKPLWPSDQLLVNMAAAWKKGAFSTLFMNSIISTLIITVGKIVIAMITAFALVYFRFRFRALAFWMIFITLMLPLEVRIVPTYEIVSNVLLPIQRILEWTGLAWLIQTLSGVRVVLKLSLINTYLGLTLPLIATATGTFLFRQFFLTIPDELAEASKMDGSGALRFFWDILLPLSRTNIAALAVIMFVFGWNQYLWPLLVTTGPEYRTLTIGLTAMQPGSDATADWNVILAGALLVMMPPVLVVVLAQRWFVKGLVNTDK
ncbi:ABC transporter permease subunit [Rhizobium sp. XQZ8]|uniref:ABC transporter permease subunit n=1 Tax=Rhizobium populisoli TaxID=2859785 RepID=UPI001CA4DDF6|nr:ABC transporter permease subunit [Rhizobium populisoli]MBW6424979.1 ABC transporter permease subunit [Rhizobium populisoli]